MCMHVICARLSLCAESSEEDVPMEFGASESEVRSTLVWQVESAFYPLYVLLFTFGVRLKVNWGHSQIMKSDPASRR